MCVKEGSGPEAISGCVRVDIFLLAHRTGQASCKTEWNVQKQMVVIRCTSNGKGKGTVHSRTGHEGPEVEQMYSSTLPSTSALDGGGWSTPRPGRFTPGNDPVPTVLYGRLGGPPGPV